MRAKRAEIWKKDARWSNFFWLHPCSGLNLDLIPISHLFWVRRFWLSLYKSRILLYFFPYPSIFLCPGPLKYIKIVFSFITRFSKLWPGCFSRTFKINFCLFHDLHWEKLKETCFFILLIWSFLEKPNAKNLDNDYSNCPKLDTVSNFNSYLHIIISRAGK